MKCKKITVTVLFLIISSTLFAQHQDTTYLYVSPNGDNSNTGTKEAPLANLAGAFDMFFNGKRGANKQLVIELADGIYPTSPILLWPKNNGVMDRKITVRAENQGKAILNAGKSVSLSDFKSVTDKVFRNRIQPHLRDSIVSIKLSDLGIRNIREYANYFEENEALPELYFEDERMTLSKYPNMGEKMAMESVLVSGGGHERGGSWQIYNVANSATKHEMEIHPPRPGQFTYYPEHTAAHHRWARALAQGIPVWLNGFWRVPWENSTIKIASIDTTQRKVIFSVPIKGGIGSKYARPNGGDGKEPYTLMNLLEEVDVPGEWSFDFESQRMFFYPPTTAKNAVVMIAHELSPILHLRYISNLKLEGLVFEGGLGNGVEITGGRNNQVLGCTIRKLGGNGVVINGGFQHEVRSSDLYDLGAGGVWLSGGMEDTQPPVPAKHKVINNHIHHFAKVRKVYSGGINCGFTGGGPGGHYPAVGNYIANNLIHTTPHVGILHGSLDNVFEYNEVFDWSRELDDMGAIYCYSHYPYINNTIVRYNFFHSSANGDGIYFDHNMENAEVYGNILFNLGDAGANRKAFGYFIKNGDADIDRDHFKMYNNLSINIKGPYFVRLIDKDVFYHNVAVNSKEEDFDLFYYKELEAEPQINPQMYFEKNKAYQGDIGFEDMENFDFTLKSNAKIFNDLPGFEPIPFEKMGLYVDKYRKEVKNRHRNLEHIKKLISESKH